MKTMKKLIVLITGIVLMSVNTYTEFGVWKTLHDDQQVKIETTAQNCDDATNGIYNNYNIFSFTNKTNQKIEVSFNFKVWDNNRCLGCDAESKAEFTKSIVLNPNETRQTSCTDYSLNIIHGSNDGTIQPIDKFEIYNVKIQNI